MKFLDKFCHSKMIQILADFIILLSSCSVTSVIFPYFWPLCCSVVMYGVWYNVLWYQDAFCMLISSFSFYLIGFLKKSQTPPAFVLFLTVPLNSRTSLIQCEESQRQVNSKKFLKLLFKISIPWAFMVSVQLCPYTVMALLRALAFSVLAPLANGACQ